MVDLEYRQFTEIQQHPIQQVLGAERLAKTLY